LGPIQRSQKKKRRKILARRTEKKYFKVGKATEDLMSKEKELWRIEERFSAAALKRQFRRKAPAKNLQRPEQN